MLKPHPITKVATGQSALKGANSTTQAARGMVKTSGRPPHATQAARPASQAERPASRAAEPAIRAVRPASGAAIPARGAPASGPISPEKARLNS